MHSRWWCDKHHLKAHGYTLVILLGAFLTGIVPNFYVENEIKAVIPILFKSLKILTAQDMLESCQSL